MKIGLSYSRCIKDIVDGRVDLDDVLVIISRTNFDPNDDEQWADIWTGYGGGGTFGGVFNASEWMNHTAEDELKFRNITLHLWNEGKIHQPRKFGARPSRRREYWLEAVLPSDELERNPAAKDAWDRFQVVAGLSNIKLDSTYQ